MRHGACLVGLALLLKVALAPVAAGCSSSTVAPVDACMMGGGFCVTTTDQVACGSILAYACNAGYTCCAPLTGGATAPADAGVDAGDPLDTTGDAATDPLVVDGATDAGAAKDAQANRG